MRTIVAGGAGLIGCHLVKKLLDEGREVLVVDDLSRGNLQNLKDLEADAPLISADLRDPKQAYEALKGAEVVFHLAARVGSVELLHGSKRAELDALWSNLAIDGNVFRACLEHGVKKLIYASSVSVYPIHTQHRLNVTLSETDLDLTTLDLGLRTSDSRLRTVIDPEGGYGWAKLLGEIQLSWMAKARQLDNSRPRTQDFGLRTIQIGIARIFNVYGEGEDFGKTAHVVPALIRKAIRYPEEDFIVWGDGTQTRDFLYVSDCVDALIKLEAALPSGVQGPKTRGNLNPHSPTPNPQPLVINIGSDTPVPISVLAEKIVKISGKDIKIKYDPSKPVGPLSRTANITKAKEILNWKPEVSLEDGLRRTYTWVEKRLAETRGDR